MSARKQRRPSKEALAEAEALVESLKNVMSPEEFNEFVECSLNPEKAAEAKRKEEADAEIGNFIGSIPITPAGYRLPARFSKMWGLLLDLLEEETRERFIASGSNPKHLDSWIKRGWVTADSEALVIKSHLKQPPSNTHPIPAILINDDGHWKAPSILNLIIKEHPFTRAITLKLPQLTKKQEIARAMKRAETYRKEGCYHGTILAQTAERLDLFLYEPMFAEQEEFGWMKAAKRSRQFWEVLDAAIGFGRSLSNFEIYGDGSVESLIQRSLVLSGGRRLSESGSKIEALLKEYREAGDNKVTPSSFLTWLGGKRSKLSDAEEIIFPEGSRGYGLKGISWDRLKNLVKAAARRMKKGIIG